MRQSKSEHKAATESLYRFPLNFMKFHELMQIYRMELSRTDYEALQYGQAPPSNGGHSDPVAKRAERLDSLKRRINFLFSELKPIAQTRSEYKISTDERAKRKFLIMELRYFARMKLNDIVIHTGWTYNMVLRTAQNVVKDVIEARRSFSRKPQNTL